MVLSPLHHMFCDVTREDTFNYLIQLVFLVTFTSVFIILFFIKAYYGKFYSNKSLLPTINTRLSWIIQEIPCVIISLLFIYNNTANTKAILFIFPFLFHYIHRSLIFPFIIKTSKNFPLEITLMAFSFCVFNSLILNRSAFYFCDYESTELTLVNYVGLGVMICGMCINIFHDHYMAYLRKQKEGYILPKGYLFNYVTNPNYFGEIVEWFGYWIYTQNFSAFVFFISTVGNLFPRAIKYKQWYLTKFKDECPKHIKAVIPFII